jgi:hypothetical protein
MEMKKNCWKMRRLSLFGCLTVLMLFVTVPGHAALVDNGGGLIYDTDLNITWYDAPAVEMTWGHAMSWASGLTVGGTAAGSWRLPNTLPVNGSSYNYATRYDGTTDSGWNISSPYSEMGHLFHVELGNKGFYLPDGSYPQSGWGSGWGLKHKGPFTNLQTSHYWSGTEYAPDPTYAWRFNFDDGWQLAYVKGNISSDHFALAVHPGNVGAPVPIPGAVWLLGSGLIGLVAIRRRFRK